MVGPCYRVMTVRHIDEGRTPTGCGDGVVMGGFGWFRFSTPGRVWGLLGP
ncbi:MAG: hypothetical protein ACKO3H_03220 [Verrucomicrobiota bacterium]